MIKQMVVSGFGELICEKTEKGTYKNIFKILSKINEQTKQPALMFAPIMTGTEDSTEIDMSGAGVMFECESSSEMQKIYNEFKAKIYSNIIIPKGNVVDFKK